LVSSSPDHRDRQHHLSLLAGAGPRAAAAAIRIGRLNEAWEVLEQGRGILLGQLLTRSGLDLAGLRQHSPPLAAQVDELRALLNADAVKTIEGEGVVDLGTRRRQAVQAWNRLLADIRSKVGFERFGLPPTITELRQAAGDGVAVAVNLTHYGCDALILSRRGVERVALPDLRETDATERISQILTHVYSPSHIPEYRQSILEATNVWLWDTTVEPVLNHLGYTSTPPTGRQWPRVWWIPIGPLAALPLHAAGHHDDPPGPHRRCALDRVISSYAPTARMLRHARSRPRPPVFRAVVVGANDASGMPPLAFATAEASLVADLIRAGHARSEVQTLIDEDATSAAVMSALQEATWAHFACKHSVIP
jgi:hypothetical protein